MKFLKVKQVSFEEVMNAYNQDHAQKNDWWEKRNLERANEKFGNWVYVQIPISEIGNIVMPQYKHEGANITPEEGAFLSDAYLNFKNKREFYEKENTQFCKRFDFHLAELKENKSKAIFLSQEPLFVGTSYSGLHKFKGMITHLDGFHRLMALMALENKPKYLEAYLAATKEFIDENC